MKIVFLLTQDLDSPSGLGRYAPLARELARLGHTLKIYALHSNYASLSQKSYQEGNLTVEYVAPMHVRKKDSRKMYYSLPALLVVVIRAFLALTQAALSERPDILWVGKPHPMNGMAGLIAKARWNCRLFLDCDDDESGSGTFRYGWQRSVIGLFERWLPRFADRITVNTMVTHENMLGCGVKKEKIIYLPNGVDLDRFSKTEDPEKTAVLKESLGLSGAQVISYIGTLSISSHAVDLLIEAFTRLHQTLPTVRLLLVGGGEDFDDLSQRVKALGLTSSVIFTGRIDPNLIQAYYRLSDVTVDPVYNNLAARGRSPLKMFEAWACGVPFVTSPVGDRAALAGEPPAALLVTPGDARALAEGLENVLLHTDQQKTLILRGYERLQEFTWKRLVERVSCFISESPNGNL